MREYETVFIVQPEISELSKQTTQISEDFQAPIIRRQYAQALLDRGEITAGLDRSEALFEAARCYSCGNCFECDGCYGACPENAIIKLGQGKGYAVRYEQCTGCQACFLQCPCHAIEMIKTEARA